MSNVKNYTEQSGERTIIEGELVIQEGGKLIFNGQELKPASIQADSSAEDVAGIVDDFNTLLSKLKAAGLME